MRREEDYLRKIVMMALEVRTGDDTDGQNQGGRERERHSTRAVAGPSRVEATRPISRPHTKWDRTRKKSPLVPRLTTMCVKEW